MHTSNNEGSITIFVALIIPVIVAFFFTMIDFTRIVGARNQIRMAAGNAIESSLGRFDKTLYSEYNLLSLKGDENIKTNIRSVVRKNLYTSDDSNESFYGFNITDSDISIDFTGNLFHPDVFREEMIRSMKYQGPTNLMLGTLTKFTALGKVEKLANATDDLEDLSRDLKKLNAEINKVNEAKLALVDFAVLVVQNFFMDAAVPIYKDTYSATDLINSINSKINNNEKEFISGFIATFLDAAGLKAFYLPRALTAKYMQCIVKAYDNLEMPEGVEKIEQLTSSQLANALNDLSNAELDKFSNSIDLSGFKKKFNTGITAIGKIRTMKPNIEAKIANYERTHLTQQNLSGENGATYESIKKDIETTKNKISAFTLDRDEQNFKNANDDIVVIDMLISQIKGSMDVIVNGIGDAQLSEEEYKRLEEYFNEKKTSLGFEAVENLNYNQYSQISKEMLKGLSNESILVDSLPGELYSLKTLIINAFNYELGFSYDLSELEQSAAGKAAKKIWDYFLGLSFDAAKLPSIINALPGEQVISSEIVNSMPGGNSGQFVPKGITINEYFESVKQDGAFNDKESNDFFKAVIEALKDIGNESLDKMYLMEYVMTYFKQMVDVKTRMPVEYSGSTILENEIEAIINGECYSDLQNKTDTTLKVAAFRTILNVISIMSSDKKEIVFEITKSLGIFAIPASIAIIAAWAAFETNFDLIDIFRGYQVPLIKNKSQWITQIKLNGQIIQDSRGVAGSLSAGESIEIDMHQPDRNLEADKSYNDQDDPVALNYSDVCRLRLLLTSNDKIVKEAENLIYANMKNRNTSFDATEYFVGIKVGVGSDVKEWFKSSPFTETGSNNGYKINKIEINKGYD